MSISSKLLKEELIYGRGSQQYLLLRTDGNMDISNVRPKQQISIGQFIDQSQQNIRKCLKNYTFREIEIFATNVSYAIEKRKKEFSGLKYGLIIRATLSFCLYLIVHVLNSEYENFMLFFLGIEFFTRIARHRSINAPEKLSGQKQNHDRVADLVFDQLTESWQVEHPHLPCPYNNSDMLAKELVEKGFERACTDRIGFLFFRRTLKERLTYRKMLDYRREMIKKEYFVVTHGQGVLGGFMVNVITKVMRKLEPNRPLHNTLALRFSWQSDELSPTDWGVKKFFKSYRCIRSDDFISQELVAVSINPWDQLFTESALSFWLIGGNGNQEYGTILSNTFLNSKLVISEKMGLVITSAFNKVKNFIVNSEQNIDTLGQLYTISIPNALIKNEATCPIYPSMPHGFPLCCRSAKIVNQIGRVWLDGRHFQGRVLASALVPESGIQIREFNTHTEQFRQMLDTEADALSWKIVDELRRFNPKIFLK